MNSIAYRVTVQYDAPEGEGAPQRDVSATSHVLVAYARALWHLAHGASTVAIERILFFKASAHTMRILFVDHREIQA